jgi:hypothetical protein
MSSESKFGDSLGPIFKLAEELGVLQKIKVLFVAEYNEAARRLADVLGELEKNYTAIDDELERFVGLSFGPPDTDVDADRKLKPFERAEVERRMHDARGHCSRIKNIYDVYLKEKLGRLLYDDTKRYEVTNLFVEMMDMDGKMSAAITDLADVLSMQFTKLQRLVKDRKFDDANREVAEARVAIQPLRQRMNQALVGLLRLRADYMEVSGVA